MSVVFTGKGRRSFAIDHCPTVAITVRSFICLVPSHGFLLRVCTSSYFSSACLRWTLSLFRLFCCTFNLFIFLLAVSTILSVLVLLIICFFYFIFQNWFLYFLFLFPSLFIIHCSFLFFIHYFHRNIFPNFVIYLVLSTLFIPFSSCLFSITSVLIFLRLNTAFCFYFSLSFPFLYTHPCTDTFSDSIPLRRSVS